MQFEVIAREKKPMNSEYPLSDEILREHFQDLLPFALVRVSYEYFPNTSDVVIASSSFETVSSINEWGLRVIASEEPSVSRVRELLLEHGVPALTKWFNSAENQIKQDLSKWCSYSLTIRYENDELIFDAQEAHREMPRPAAGWPQEPYKPHQKET